jgi:allantoin racemase
VRLLYLLVDDLQPSDAELRRLTTAGQALMAPGDEFTVAPIAFGPSEYYESALGFALCVPGIVHAVLSRQGDHDAIVIGCFGDPGLRAARTVASVPVIGACEAATAFVQLVAHRFGIVTIMRSDIPEIEARMSEMELAHRCVGVDAIERPFYALMDDPDDTAARLERAARSLVGRGAQAILLGCMSYGFSSFETALAHHIGLPVINPLRAAIAAASGLRTIGVAPSPAWVAAAPDPTAAIEHLRRLEHATGHAAVGTPR